MTENIADQYKDMIPLLDKAKEEHTRGPKQICKCGHTGRSHATIREMKDVEHCKAGAIKCNCKKFEPVVLSSDARVFRYATGGSGTTHPLTKGIAAAAQKGAVVEALPAFTCGVRVDGGCVSQSRVWPISWDRRANAPTPIDLGDTVFMCEDHVKEFGIAHIIGGLE